MVSQKQKLGLVALVRAMVRAYDRTWISTIITNTKV